MRPDQTTPGLAPEAAGWTRLGLALTALGCWACTGTPAPAYYPTGAFPSWGDGGFSGGDVIVDATGIDGGAPVTETDGGSDAAEVTDGAADAASPDTGPVDAGPPPCTPTKPPDETCDGVDNDCDGETDEGSCDIGNPCTVGKCDSAKALAGEDGCTFSQPADLPCEDGDKCTKPDVCKGGACISGQPLGCNDDNSCTLDECDKTTGECDFKLFPDGVGCNDGKVCTEGDKCLGGKCVGKVTALCDDAEPCTEDDCDSTGKCLHSPVQGTACTDGNACTAPDTCGGGGCVPGLAVVCDDGNGCTADSCDPKAGCVHQPKTAGVDCSDGVCKKDGKCSAQGLCEGEVDLCDDNDPCTTDTCAGAAGCQHAAVAENTICGPGAACKSNTQVTTEVVGKPKLPIPDNNPIGVNDTIDFPDKGVASSVEVHVALVNSDIASMRIELYDPDNNKFVLYDKNGIGTALDTIWPTISTPVSGKLSTWVGKNPKGKWRIIVYDLKFKDNTTDGEVTTWSVKAAVTSNKMVCVQP